MITIAILPESPGLSNTGYRAIAGEKQAAGKTAGEALDALACQLDQAESGTLVVVQNLRPDRFFGHEQRRRLQELMSHWRAARDQGQQISAEEQEELTALIDIELRASVERAASIADGVEP